jgi:hypothetical protein
MFKNIFTAVVLSVTFLALNVIAAPEKGIPTKPTTPQGEMEILVVNRTIANYDGTAFRLCRGRTLACPERCGHSGGFATFSVVDYLQYDKRGKYGDDKKTLFTVQVTDFKKMPIGGKEINKRISGMKKGDLVLLCWNHTYGEVRPGVKSPQRPLIELRKITGKEAAILRDNKTDLPSEKSETP